MISIFLHIIFVQGQYFTNYSQIGYQYLKDLNDYYGYYPQNLSLISQNLQGWFVQIGIGYPTQYFNVQVDTGSDILWVAYQNCRNCNIRNQYNSKGQSQFQTNGSVYTQKYYYGVNDWYDNYDEAECSGLIASDAVSLIGSQINETFLMMFATYESGFPFSDQCSGIMGLSNNQSFMNIFQDSYQNGQISSDVFGLVISPLPFTSYLLYGNFYYYFFDSLIWVTSEDTQSWKFSINLLLINGIDYTQYMYQSNYGYLASGESCLVVNAQLFNILQYDFFYPAGCSNYDGIIYCPCWNDNNASYPNITFVLNQVDINIPYQSLFLNFYESPPGDVCQVCLKTNNEDIIVFGGPVFQSVITVFDKDNNQVGFYGGVQNDIPNS
ncbi:hypothetical protein pb186bvf_002798 [Paramecium bursaria]